MRIEPATGFGGDINLFFALAFELTDEPFASPIAIDIGRINEINTQLDSPSQRRQRFVIALRIPTIRRSPSAKLISETSQPMLPSLRYFIAAATVDSVATL